MNSASHAEDREPAREWRGAKGVDSQPIPLRNDGGKASLETVCTDLKSMRRVEDRIESAQESQREDCELIHGGGDVNVS
jgi:hypothetical protein